MRSRHVALGLGLLPLGAAAALRWARGPGLPVGPGVGEILRVAGAAPPADWRADAARLTVVSWNLAWGYGWGSEGKGGPRSAEFIHGNLERIASTLLATRADLVLLQEVDFDAHRSGRVDQARWLAEQAGYPFLAPWVSWDLRYMPYPGVSPRGHWGRLRSGGAILSRHPITLHDGERFPRPREQSAFYNQFYVGRYTHRVVVDAPVGAVEVWNLHLEAWVGPAREREARWLANRLAEAPARRRIVAGDFNTVPPEASLRRAYPDEPQTDHDGDPTLPLLRDVPGLRELPNDGAEIDGFTFPAHAPNRRLDHAFVGGLRPLGCRVLVDAGAVSDHLPLCFELGADEGGV